MKIVRPELSHATSIDEAESLQGQVRESVSIVPLARPPHRIAGCDTAYSTVGDLGFGAVTVLDLETLREIETATARSAATFPYVPGLFSFHEIPILLAALERLTQPPDVLLVDGHGIAHPRGAGLATHLGVVLDLPVIGCAKTPLGGTWSTPPETPGAWTEVSMDTRVVGLAYRSQAGNPPIFVSPGHRIDIPSILELLPRLLRQERLPQPLLRAHDAAVRAKKRA